MIEPENIPQFTGDLGQLDHHITALRGEADGIRQAGGAAHTQFQRLSAFYQAPEAEDLFASTVPVRDRADGFGDKLATVADALATYATEVAPIAARLKHLQSEAATFVAGLKTSSGAFDENWAHDQDKVDQHQTLMNGVAEAQAAFTAAEIAANNKITALVGGTQYMMVGGGKALFIPRGVELYGYTADALEQMEKLPWGTPVSKSHNWWDPDDLGYYAKSFVWDGLIVDNVWGTIDGLATLAGVHGGDAAGNAWDGLVRGIVGGETYLMESGGQKPTGFLASDFAQDSKVYAKEFGKSFVAWDMWKENPARAAATVVFNALTLGAGPLKVASAGRVGTAAKVASVTAKIGDAIDPINAAARVTARGIPKLAEVTANLRGVNDIPDLRAPHSILELSDGSKVRIENGEFIRVDDAGRAISDTPLHEPPANARAAQHETAQQRELAEVGAASRPSGATAHTGENLTPEASHGAANGSSGDTSRTAKGVPGPAGAGHAVGSETPRKGSGAIGNGPGGTSSGSHGGGGLDNLGRTGNDAVGDGANGADRPTGDVPGQRTEVERPSFIREGANPYGPRGSLTLEQIEEIQVYRANHEPGYFEHYYRKDGTRRFLERYDESGHTPPQLTRLSDDAPLTRAKDAPEPPKPHFLDDDYISVKSDTVTSKARRGALEEAARIRHFAIKWDNLVSDWKAETGKAHELHGTIDSAAQWGEARGAYKESHTLMGEKAEDFGEAAAEYHYIAENHPDFTKETLLGPKSGNDQFDQVWTHEDGRVVVIEAKSSPTTELGRRTLPNGRQVSQGSREYFFDIIDAMEKRGEFDLAETLDKALNDGKLEYVVVKGEKNAGTYTGFKYRRFDISKGTLP
ncbi:MULTISPECIES: hypothetical protein [unclassified Streptomyces]|uniref:hypothetical protein n=1 Tax=unclassified Streptomyces TaxID=2593676 RepID=UPI002E812B7A|nr:hypothetical protein [Streptomyces sp. NBC_00589]WTI39653.1 hypothetical protein OIC96_34135 [Streptomyces sp. NBC_00775]WUB26668.1 hypothetical protein OHA51_15595 [Streptomyces sp. NBC_00589]